MDTAPHSPVTEPPLQPAPKRQKSKFWRRLGIAALVTVAGMVAVGTLTPQGRQIVRVQQNPQLIFDNVGSDHVNILLIGEDRTWKETEVFDKQRNKMVRWHVIDEEAPVRSDTMIVVSLDRSSQPGAIRMVSFPRDARVRFTDLKGKRHKAKMNSVYASGGDDPKMREQVLREFFRDEMGLRINRVARIRIEGFTGLIDEVGGIDVNVDGALEKDKRTGKLYRGPITREDKYGQWKVDLQPGMQHLNGEEAVGYARFRVDREGDSGRIRRQQQVMRALAKRISTLPLMQLPGAVGEVKKQFATDMSDEELASMALFTKKIGASSQISPLTVFGENARTGNKADIVINKPDNIKLFSYIFGDSFDAEKFLSRSPSTTRDELGVINNRNPAAIEVLRGAGILSPDGEVAPSPMTEVPVRSN